MVLVTVVGAKNTVECAHSLCEHTDVTVRVDHNALDDMFTLFWTSAPTHRGADDWYCDPFLRVLLPPRLAGAEFTVRKTIIISVFFKSTGQLCGHLPQALAFFTLLYGAAFEASPLWRSRGPPPYIRLVL